MRMLLDLYLGYSDRNSLLYMLAMLTTHVALYSTSTSLLHLNTGVHTGKETSSSKYNLQPFISHAILKELTQNKQLQISQVKRKSVLGCCHMVNKRAGDS